VSPITPRALPTARSSGKSAEPQVGSEQSRPTPVREPALNRAAIREQIAAIVERHLRAVEIGNRESMRADMSPEQAKIWTPYLDAMPTVIKNVKCSVRGPVEITVVDATHARTSFRLEITGVRSADSKRLPLYDDSVRWELTHTDGRWLITSTSD
jgi:hypothetical protein